MAQPIHTWEHLGMPWRSTRVAATYFLLTAFLTAHLRSATFTVNTTSDSGPGSLREAILKANTNAGADLITFAIQGSGVHTIKPLSPLPPIADPLTVAAHSSTDYDGVPLIQLDGSSAGTLPAFRLFCGQSVLKGLAINRFSGGGVHIKGYGSNSLLGNFVGTDLSGQTARPNGQFGVLVEGSRYNQIGGSGRTHQNVISGNLGAGIYFLNSADNLVLGNLIGVSASGNAPLGNRHNGISLYNSPSNRIGTTVAPSNVISANHESGVYIHGAASLGNTVIGNLIGLEASGQNALGNLADGVTITAPCNQVGGTEPGARNIISGNGLAGIYLNGTYGFSNRISGNYVGTDIAGRMARGNGLSGITLHRASRNIIGGSGTFERNLISGNSQSGCLFSTNSSENVLLGNWVGVDATGTNALPNSFNGVTLLGASSNHLGGASPGDGNILSGNVFYGVELAFASAGNRLLGNLIGTDPSGLKAVANRQSGVRIAGSDNQIGGAAPGEGNLISGNLHHGVFLVGNTGTRNTLQGNFVGINITGTEVLGNGKAGILLSAASGNLIGGSGAGQRNVVSGNSDAGILLLESSNNRLFGNRIGSDLSGNWSLPNTLEGIFASGGTSNHFGGSEPAEGNLIGGNGTRGIFLTNTTNNRIEGNVIGATADRSKPLPNRAHALEFEQGASHNLVGGDAANLIAFSPSGYAGVRVRNGSEGNAILNNLIFSTGALAIDLGPVGVNENDDCDTDSGANQHQNHPLLTDAVRGTSLFIRGVLPAAPGKALRVQFFGSSHSPPSGSGEAQRFLGQCIVQTDASCTGHFEVALPSIQPATFVSATATDTDNNTSEFSGCIPVLALPSLSATLSNGSLQLSWSAEGECVLSETLDLSPPILWKPIATNGVEIRTLRLPISERTRFFRLERK